MDVSQTLGEFEMKYMGHISWSIAALSSAIFLPHCAYAQGNMQTPSSQNVSDQSSQSAKDEAVRMVPAQAYLLGKLDAKDMKPGTQFTARLADNVQLKNGPELPKGTDLIGKVSTDDTQLKGTSKLALRITEAQLKDGKRVPIKATIVGVYAPETETAAGFAVAPGQEQANHWTDKVLRVDQVNAVRGADLHSRVAGNNSGVFVSTKRDNVKISAGSELALAIAEQNGGEQTSRGGPAS